MQTAAETAASQLTPMTTREASPHPLAILALALVTRLLALWFTIARFPHNWLYTHGIELGTLAQSLLTGQGLSSPFGGSTGPTALLAPGYPAVIAFFFRIFGSFTFAAAIAVMAMQLVLSVMTVLVIIVVVVFDLQSAADVNHARIPWIYLGYLALGLVWSWLSRAALNRRKTSQA